MSRIVEARKRLLPDLVAYRNYLDSLSTELVELAKVSDPEIRSSRLQLKVETEVSQRIAKMEREMGRLGLQPVRAVLSAQSLAPPALLGALTNTVGLPPAVTMAGVAATCLVGASATALSKRAQMWQSHPTGYLLALKHELTPNEAVARTRRAFRRVAEGRR
jgi:hypothetical protein